MCWARPSHKTRVTAGLASERSGNIFMVFFASAMRVAAIGELQLRICDQRERARVCSVWSPDLVSCESAGGLATTDVLDSLGSYI